MSTVGTFERRDDRGRLHCEDGPAVDRAGGQREWWVRGLRHRKDGPAIVHADGCREYYHNGLRHRENGPAVEDCASGTREWFVHGQRHRDGGPAVEQGDGTLTWWFNGLRHREDGPAIEWANGTRSWHLEDRELSEEEWLLEMQARALAVVVTPGQRSRPSALTE